MNNKRHSKHTFSLQFALKMITTFLTSTHPQLNTAILDGFIINDDWRHPVGNDANLIQWDGLSSVPSCESCPGSLVLWTMRVRPTSAKIKSVLCETTVWREILSRAI